MNDSILHSARTFLEGTLLPATVYLRDGKIEKIVEEEAAPAGAKDLGNAVLMPGVIDAHVHINEPGRADWEGFETGTNAAAAGGTTSLVDMPLNSSPVTIDADSLQQKKAASEGKMRVHVGFYGGLVPGNAAQMEALVKAGVLGIKAFLTHSGIDEFPNATIADLDAAMPVLAKLGIPLLVHCELDEPGTMEALGKDPRSYPAYLASRPKAWENRAVQLMIDLCRKYRCPVHIVHVSSAEALPLIKAAKKEGLPLTAETAPHYLLFCAEEIPDGQTIFKCAPPIRERANNELLKDALREGVLDFIATDHSPAPPALKELESGNLLRAWGGIAGLQFLLPASWTAMKEEVSVEQFIPLITSAPARFLKLDGRKGHLRPGFDADLVAWHPEAPISIGARQVEHQHKISPYIDRPLFGRIEQTWVCGQPQLPLATQVTKQGTWLFRK
ncbi:MAG: allantoinase AllB [Chitinophagaceae bacterium]|nr:MAG: allantoinase AllB [Chitinophagaceae bacterium]